MHRIRIQNDQMKCIGSVLLFLAMVIAMVSTPALARQVVSPESVGMASGQLARINTLVNRYMADKTIPGAVVLVARHGKIAYLKAFGKADEGRPLEINAVFRLASLSKPIVGPSGILQLMDQGEILLSDPVSRYISDFKKMRVAQFDAAGKMKLVPAKREITIHDLLTFTAGISSLWGDSPLATMYREAGLGMLDTDKTLEAEARLAARLPLACQPGETWQYSGLQLNVLGYVVETVSGMRLDRLMAKQVFSPLQMTDTHFYPPTAKWPRVTGYYYANDGKNGKKGDPFVEDIGAFGFIDRADRSFKKNPKRFSPSGGLHSTAYDVFRYFQMLLNGGELDGVRVLSKQAVKLMLQNHIGDRRETQYGHGWGYAVGVQVEDAPAPVIGKTYGGKGAFSWDGYYGPVAFGNPVNDTVIVLMTHVWTVAQTWELQARIVNIVNRAISD